MPNLDAILAPLPPPQTPCNPLAGQKMPGSRLEKETVRSKSSRAFRESSRGEFGRRAYRGRVRSGSRFSI
jgi:hypothetical protein